MGCYNQVGEFYDIRPTDGQPKDYVSRLNDIALYDESHDIFVKITGADMLNNCHRFDKETGEVIYIPESPLAPGVFTEEELSKDIFQAVEGRGTVPARVFGHIRPEYYTVEDVKQLAQTAANQIELSEADQTAWNKGLRAHPDHGGLRRLRLGSPESALGKYVKTWSRFSPMPVPKVSASRTRVSGPSRKATLAASRFQ